MPLVPAKTCFSRSGRTVLGGLFILLACALAYAPVLHGKFLWDDLYLVGSNPLFKSPRFLVEVFRHWLYLDSFSLYYRPIQNLSYLLDYAIWNREVFGYHASNIVFHAASAFLLVLVIRRSMGEILRESASPAFIEAASFSVGLLWAVHPIHNAAVAYVAGRADSIAMMFALAGWLLFLNESAGWRRWIALAAAPVCFLVALCAKEIAFIWIALFAVYLFGFDRKRPLRAKAAVVASLLCMLGIYVWLRHLPGPRVTQQGMDYPPLPERVILMFRALGDYTRLIFYPGNLHMERSVWNGGAYRSLGAWQQNLRGEYLSLCGLLTIALFVFACWIPWPGRKIRILGVSWFVLGFLPISNLFPLNAQVAEHWIYMASAGYLIMLAGFACAVPVRYRRLLACIIPAALLALGIRTAFRAADWADPEIFFRRTIAAGGMRDRISLNLASVLSERGKLKEAEAILRQDVAELPDYPSARIALGMNLIQQGRKAEAGQYLAFSPHTADIVAASTPQSWRAALDLSSSEYDSHHVDAALAILDTAIGRYPGVWELVQARAKILMVKSGPEAGLAPVADYARRNWWHLESHLLLARILAEAKNYPASLAACREAATHDIHSAAPFEQAARTDILAGQLSAALAAQVAAIERGGDQPARYMMLAAILDQMHQPEKARAAVQQAKLLQASGIGG